jgi:hypothetical protein
MIDDRRTDIGIGSDMNGRVIVIVIDAVRYDRVRVRSVSSAGGVLLVWWWTGLFFENQIDDSKYSGVLYGLGVGAATRAKDKKNDDESGTQPPTALAVLRRRARAHSRVADLRCRAR